MLIHQLAIYLETKKYNNPLPFLNCSFFPTFSLICIWPCLIFCVSSLGACVKMWHAAFVSCICAASISVKKPSNNEKTPLLASILQYTGMSQIHENAKMHYYLFFCHSKHIKCVIYTVFVSLTFFYKYLYLCTVTQHQTIDKTQLRWSHTLKPLITVLSFSSLHSSSFPFLLFEQKQWIKSCFYLMCPPAPQTQPTDTHLHWFAVNWFYTSVIPRPGYNRNWN